MGDEFKILNTITAGIVTPEGANNPLFDASSIQGIPVSSETGSLLNDMVMYYDSNTGWFYGHAITGHTGVTGGTGFTGYTGYTGYTGIAGFNLNTGYTGYTGYTGPAGLGAGTEGLGDLSDATTTSTTGILFYTDPGGTDNFYLGQSAGAIDTGSNNLFVGTWAGRLNTTGASNIFVGDQAGRRNTTGDFNIFIGSDAGPVNTFGRQNIFAGQSAGLFNTTGSRNTCFGGGAGFSLTTGSRNTFVGQSAGFSINTGNDNVALGQFADYPGSGSGSINIFTTTADTDDSFFAPLNTGAGGGMNDIPVEWDSSSKELFASTSSVRFKDVIGDFTADDEKFMALHPVKYNPKGAIDGRVRAGLLAEELTELFPEFVIYEKDNQTPLSIGYSYMVVLIIDQIKKVRNELKILKSSRNINE